MDDAARLLERYYDEVWLAGRHEALDELLHEGYRDHDPPVGFGADRAAARRFAERFAAGVREPRLSVLALVAGRDAAAAHWRFEWLQHGPFLGDAAHDGRRLVLRGCDLVRVRDGRIADIWHVERLVSAR